LRQDHHRAGDVSPFVTPSPPQPYCLPLSHRDTATTKANISPGPARRNKGYTLVLARRRRPLGVGGRPLSQGATWRGSVSVFWVSLGVSLQRIFAWKWRFDCVILANRFNQYKGSSGASIYQTRKLAANQHLPYFIDSSA